MRGFDKSSLIYADGKAIIIDEDGDLASGRGSSYFRCSRMYAIQIGAKGDVHPFGTG